MQDQWQITGDDDSGMQVVTFTGVGQGGADGGAPGGDGAVLPADGCGAGDRCGRRRPANPGATAATDAPAADEPRGARPGPVSPDAGVVGDEGGGCGCDLGGRGGGGFAALIVLLALVRLARRR